MILPAFLLTLDQYRSWRVEKVVLAIRSAVRTICCNLQTSKLATSYGNPTRQEFDSLTLSFCFRLFFIHSKLLSYPPRLFKRIEQPILSKIFVWFKTNYQIKKLSLKLPLFKTNQSQFQIMNITISKLYLDFNFRSVKINVKLSVIARKVHPTASWLWICIA